MSSLYSYVTLDMCHIPFNLIFNRFHLIILGVIRSMNVPKPIKHSLLLQFPHFIVHSYIISYSAILWRFYLNITSFDVWSDFMALNSKLVNWADNYIGLHIIWSSFKNATFMVSFRDHCWNGPSGKARKRRPVSSQLLCSIKHRWSLDLYVL